MVQPPEQQSSLFAQTSPVWMQKDAPSWQRPLVHRLEQHSPSVAHVFPAVRQVRFRGVHVWLVASHVPLQQLPFDEHVFVSEMQAWALAHLPALHWRLQQSVAAWQLPPEATHEVVDEAHVSVAPSHTPEQQSAPLAQIVP